MLHCSLSVRTWVRGQGRAHQMVVTSTLGPVGQRCGEMTANTCILAAKEMKLGQAKLRLLGYLRGELSEARETIQNAESILVPS